jgi:hypothetical protein
LTQNPQSIDQHDGYTAPGLAQPLNEDSLRNEEQRQCKERKIEESKTAEEEEKKEVFDLPKTQYKLSEILERFRVALKTKFDKKDKTP